MPPYVKNTGMSSLNELFAMKKNLAYETKFEHRLSSMMKDFFHKKENLKQDIRMVYNDLQSIKLSTGYSLSEAESARSADRLRRRPSAPTIYLPPVGVRLVQKYIGVDVRRQSLMGERSPGRQQRTLDSILNQTIGVGEANSKYKTDTVKETTTKSTAKETRKVEILVNSHEEDTKREHHMGLKLREQTDNIVDKSVSNTFLEVTESQEDGNSFLQRNEIPLDGSTVLSLNEATRHENTMSNAEEITHPEAVNDTAHTLIAVTEEAKDDKEKILIDTDYNLTERRSSRSTFRGRSSTRLPSQSNALFKYNQGVAGLSKRKSNIKNFYLDYGDGKLHDPMEIPKVKDCSRPWCNPHCKTCRNRTYSRPCFVLIPAEENVRKRQIPQDKRRPSMFPKYLGSQMKDQTGNTQNDGEKNDNSLSFSNDTSNKIETLQKANANGNENIEPTHDLILNEEESKDEKNDDAIAATDKSLHQNIGKHTKGYSKKRMNELAMPRGGPPAEVRFSKMSLRKKQEQLIEDERTKALTEYESENLIKIQGKISMFLALLNQQELMGKPVKMVDIPVRMDAIISDTSKNKKGKRKRQRNVHFNSRPRLLS